MTETNRCIQSINIAPSLDQITLVIILLLLSQVYQHPTSKMAESSGGGSAAAAPKFTRKSFDFKMSKKVAELTQVVHMLFVKNHEREVELEAVRAAYEEELSNVIADARTKLEKLRLSLAEEQRRGNVARKALEQSLEEKENGFSQRLAASDVRVKELERNNEFMKEQVGRLQRIADANEKEDRREEELSEFQRQLDRAHAELQEKEAELARYREMVGRQTNQQEGNNATVGQLRNQMELMKSDLTLQITDLKSELVDTINGKERLLQKNKNLELDLRSLRKELDSRRQADLNTQPTLKTPKSPGSLVRHYNSKYSQLYSKTSANFPSLLMFQRQFLAPFCCPLFFLPLGIRHTL